MSDLLTSRRAAAVEAIIPRPPTDIAPMRDAFTQAVASQWQQHVPGALAACRQEISDSRFAKGRFIGEMYARACYSMLLVSASGPLTLRLPLRVAATLPLSRGLTIRLGSGLLTGMQHLLPRAVHRQLLLMSALMGMLDLVLDDAAPAGESAALRVASLLSPDAPRDLQPEERVIVTLAHAARQNETDWQTEYWSRVLHPAVHRYCQAEVTAVQRIPDPTGMGHRWPGIEAAIKGMWYVAGPQMGLAVDPSAFEANRWNREQHWMADTTLLMQMIDDWVDQDEDRSVRLTPVVAGDWTLDSAAELYARTIRDLAALLDASGIRQPVFQALLADLYTDYLYCAMDAMRTGLAA